MFIAYIFLALFALLLIYLLVKSAEGALFSQKRGHKSHCPLAEVADKNAFDAEALFTQVAETAGEAEYAVIDFQTTGLSTTPGMEDRVLQVAWLILDGNMALVDKKIFMVLQDTVGSAEAQRVHHIRLSELRKYGQPEEQVMSDLWRSVKDIPTLVFHNAEYDLAIWRGSMRRYAPEWIPLLNAKDVLCTMCYFPSHYDEFPRYPSLMHLSSALSGIPEHELVTGLPVAWRNVCLTRYCLEQIKRLESSEQVEHSK